MHFCHRLVLLNQQRVAFSFSERWSLSLVQRCPMVNMLTRDCDARTCGEFYGLMKFIFVGWTEMCSRHGDTAKLNIDGAGFLFLLINLFGRRISWMGQQRCDKDNRYAMPLERSIEVCISLIIRLDSLFLVQCSRSRLKQSSTSGGSLKRACQS